MLLAPQKCSCMCSPHEQSSSVQIFKPTRVVSEITSLIRCPVLLGMDCILPHPSLEVLSLSSFSSFPQGTEWIALVLIMMSQYGIWAESSSNTQCLGLAKCVMALQTIRCWPVSCLENVICLVVFFPQKKSIFV